MDASAADAGSSEGTAAASDGLETLQVGSQDMWEGRNGRGGNQEESLETEQSELSRSLL